MINEILGVDCTMDKTKDMKIGVLYIAIGRYIQFWSDFYVNMERTFAIDAQKEYYVFTDAKEMNYKTNENVHLIEVEDKGWPQNTVNRFAMFLSIEDQLRTNKFLFFFNANYMPISEIALDEIMPCGKDGLVMLTWFDNKNPNEYTYERNSSSRAYIPFGSGKKYLQGGFNGGLTAEYLGLVRECYENISIDNANGVIAVWNDESHLNRCLVDKEYKILSKIYGRPEEWREPTCPKAIFLEKKAILGVEYIETLKKEINTDSLVKRIRKKLMKQIKLGT